jgi:hypothetical protein
MKTRRLLLGTAFAALVAGGTPVLADTSPIGEVSQETPSDAVGIAAANGSERPLPYQSAVYENDIVVTKKEGTQLKFTDTTLLSVASNSKVTLDSFAFQKDTGTLSGKIRLGGGVLRLVTGSLVKHEDLNILTATTTLTIRGTDVVVEADHDGTTMVRVYEGVIRVKTCNNTFVTVKAGERVVVSPKCVATLESVADGRVIASVGGPGTGGSTPGPDGSGDGSTPGGGTGGTPGGGTGGTPGGGTGGTPGGGTGGTPGGGTGGTPGGGTGGTPGGNGAGNDPGTGNGGPGLGNGGQSNGKGNGGDPGKR